MKPGLTIEQLHKPDYSISGPNANIIMGGNEYHIKKLWMQKQGLRPYDNLDDVLPVLMGRCTEELNAYWYEKRTRETVLERSRKVVDGRYSWRTAILNGVLRKNSVMEGDLIAVWEAKHVNAFYDLEKVVDASMALLHHNMDCLNVDMAVLSVFKGTGEYCHFTVDYDPLYALELRRTEEAFWESLSSGIEPVIAEEDESNVEQFFTHEED